MSLGSTIGRDQRQLTSCLYEYPSAALGLGAGVIAGIVGYIVVNAVNRVFDWVGDRVWEWRTGQKRGQQREHSASMRARRAADRTFRLHRGDSSNGGGHESPPGKVRPGCFSVQMALRAAGEHGLLVSTLLTMESV